MNAQTPTFETRIAQYVALRDKKREMEARHKKELEPINKVMEQLEGILLNALNATGQDSAATKSGTAHKIMSTSVSLDNPDEFMRHVIATESWDLLDRKPNKTAVKDFVAEHQAPPPGVKFSQMLTLGVKAPSSTKK